MNDSRGPIKCLQEAISTFVDRGDQYSGQHGEAYELFGPIMMAFFPGGIVLKNAEDWNRYACFHMEVAKLARYAAHFEIGHIDSQHDIIVYASMLEDLDRKAQLKRNASAAEEAEAWIR
jgi:hypothetical protein